MQRSALCRSRQELSNEYLLAKIGVDTAENEPCKVCPLSAYRYPRFTIDNDSTQFVGFYPITYVQQIPVRSLLRLREARPQRSWSRSTKVVQPLQTGRGIDPQWLCLFICFSCLPLFSSARGRNIIMQAREGQEMNEKN